MQFEWGHLNQVLNNEFSSPGINTYLVLWGLMRPLGINKSFHVVLNNLTLADAEYPTDQKKKNQLSSFSISDHSFYCLPTDGYKTFHKYMY